MFANIKKQQSRNNILRLNRSIEREKEKGREIWNEGIASKSNALCFWIFFGGKSITLKIRAMLVFDSNHLAIDCQPNFTKEINLKKRKS